MLNVPSVLVNNTGSAKVVSTDEQPTTTITATGGIGGQTQENFKDYVKAGITLQISPTISASRYLRLKISLEVSTFLGSTALNRSIPPPRVTRTLDTTVNVPDGDTMVIGGIITDNKGKSRDGVPWLADLPLVGWLFRSQSDSTSRTTLYFFVTPHIMRDRDFADLAEISYKKKLEAADTIGADRDPRHRSDLRQARKSVDMRGLEVPLYRSPPAARSRVSGSTRTRASMSDPSSAAHPDFSNGSPTESQARRRRRGSRASAGKSQHRPRIRRNPDAREPRRTNTRRTPTRKTDTQTDRHQDEHRRRASETDVRRGLAASDSTSAAAWRRPGQSSTA